MKILQNRSLTLIGYSIVVALSLLPVMALFAHGLPLTHDGQDHVARIANFYQALTEGHIVPRWAGNLNWGYGHPILMFLYPLSSYIASFFHFLGFPVVDSTKWVFAVSYIASGIAMYLFVKEWTNWKAGVVASMLYLFATYRFVDLYVRGAIGEHMAFVFPPLVFYFVLKLTKEYHFRYVVGGAFSLAGLILAHNAISLMFLPLFLLYTGYCFFFLKKEIFFLVSCFFIFLFGFLLSAFFWAPAFIEGKYTLRDIVTKDEYETRFETLKRFISSPWNYGITGQFSVQIGFIQWISVMLSPIFGFFLIKKKKMLGFLILGLFLLFWITLFLMLRQSLPIWETVKTLQKFQFPWRFLSLTVFITSILSGVLVFLAPKKVQMLLMIGLLLVTVFTTFPYWRPKGYLQKSEAFYTGIYPGTTDTGESAPVWSVRFMEHEPSKRIEILSGHGAVFEVKRQSAKHEYIIDAKTNMELLENTLYFPGWNIYVDGKSAPITYQNRQYHGLMIFNVPKGKHVALVQFGATKVRKYAEYLSLAGIIGLLCSWVLYSRKIFI